MVKEHLTLKQNYLDVEVFSKFCFLTITILKLEFLI